MEHAFITVNNRELHVRVWNPDANKTVVCWHGLARNGHDFEPLGEALAERGCRVLAPDTIGRGLSQWAREPREEYHFGVYSDLALGLLEHYRVDRLSWVGTSMGGLLGMILASGALRARLDGLVLNDVGPALPADALRRITEYVRETPAFDTLTAFEERIREIYAPFGRRGDESWRQMAMACSRRLPDGRFATHYDPEIVGQFDESAPKVALWEQFERIPCPLMLLHGTRSDVLTEEIVAQMRARKPAMELLQFDDCGHAPGLHLADHIEPVVRFVG